MATVNDTAKKTGEAAKKATVDATKKTGNAVKKATDKTVPAVKKTTQKTVNTVAKTSNTKGKLVSKSAAQKTGHGVKKACEVTARAASGFGEGCQAFAKKAPRLTEQVVEKLNHINNDLASLLDESVDRIRDMRKVD